MDTSGKLVSTFHRLILRVKSKRRIMVATLPNEKREIQIIKGAENIPREQWLAFLSANPYASPFQSPGYFAFCQETGRSQYAEAYAATLDEELVALCVVTVRRERALKGFFSRRAIVYGGPLVRQEEATAWRALLQAIEKDLFRRVIYLEIRNFHDYRFLFPVYAEAGWAYKPYLNVQLRLEGKSLEDILAGMRYNRRREIRQSLQKGANYRLARTEEEVRELFGLLRDLYRRRVKVPLPDYRYFRQLFLSKRGKVFVVCHEERVIGGAFCFLLAGAGIYTLYYCGLRNCPKKIYPTHLAVLAAVEYGLQNGLKWLDLMGAGLKGEEYGVREYKKGFGGELLEHGRFIKVFDPLLFQVGRWGVAAMQKWNHKWFFHDRPH